MKTVTDASFYLGCFEYSACLCYYSLSQSLEQSLFQCSLFSRDSLKFGGECEELFLQGLRTHLHLGATQKSKVRILYFRYYTEETLPHDRIPNIDQAAHICGLCGLVGTHFREEKNSEWANSFMCTFKEEFKEV